jgi:hypothetical protein
MASKLRRFTKNDWDGYPNATNFSNDSLPYIGYNIMLEVVADIRGLCIMPHYDEKIVMQGGWCLILDHDHFSEDMIKMFAERVLEDTKDMFPVEISSYIREKGLNCDLTNWREKK